MTCSVLCDVSSVSDPLTESAHVSGGTVGGLIGGMTFFLLLVALLLVAFKVYKMRAKKKRETSLGSFRKSISGSSA